MYITAISPKNQNTNSKLNSFDSKQLPAVTPSFTGAGNMLDMAMQIKATIAKVVVPFVEKRKPEIVENISNKVVSGFDKKITEVIKIPKTNDFMTKVQLLKEIATNYMKVGDFDKAGVITAFNMKKIFNTPELSNIEKHRWIVDLDNIYNLRRTFNTPTDPKTKLYVAKTINELGYKEFLPLAESICENYHTENKAVLHFSRLLINKHYDLMKLDKFLKSGEDSKISGALGVLDEWGLPEHIELLILPSLKEGNCVSSGAWNTIGYIGNEGNIPVLNLMHSYPKNNAVEAINKIKNKEQKKEINISELVTSLKHGDKENIKSTLGHILKLNKFEHLEALYPLQNHNDWAIKGLAQRAIIRFDNRSINELLHIAKTDSDLACDVIKKISNVGNFENVDDLTPFLYVYDGFQRQTAFSAISKIGKNEKDINILIEALKKRPINIESADYNSDCFCDRSLFTFKQGDVIKSFGVRRDGNADLLGSIGTAPEHANLLISYPRGGLGEGSLHLHTNFMKIFIRGNLEWKKG